MPREIKFRAWDTERKQMFVPFELRQKLNQRLGEFGESIIFLQYTGLKDKNGAEIYEGDIVKEGDLIVPDIISIVEWGESEVHLGWTDVPYVYGWMKRPLKDYDPEPLFVYSCTEVIGNIWENPILEKK